MSALRFVILAVLLTLASSSFAQSSASEPVAEIIEQLSKLKGALSPEQQTSLQHPFDDPARLRFDYLPGDRPGVGMRTLDDAQQPLLLDVLRSALSAAGFEKAEATRALDEYLKAHVSADRYSSGRYFLAVFGEPSVTNPWAMRWEGHHISLNWTFASGKVVAVTPQFLGANPATVPDGPRQGDRNLAAEEDLGRQLVKSLSADQQKMAILPGHAAEQILGRFKSHIDPMEDTGIVYTDLTKDQQALVLAIIETFVSVHRPEVARERLKRINDTGLEKIYFAWMGGLEPGQAHYYRIQGPTFVIELENSQDNANHIHSGWRDFKDDYGADPLAEHLQRDHIH